MARTRSRLARSVAAVALLAVLVGCERWENELASVNETGTASASGPSFFPELTDDGSKVVFTSCAGDFGATDTNGDEDVYVRDLTSGVTSLVSVNAAGTGAGDDRSYFPTLSPDASKVAFLSSARDLTSPGVEEPGSHLYVRDLASGTTTLVSTGESRSAGYWRPDGTRIAWIVWPSGDVPPKIVERDLTTGEVRELAPGHAVHYGPTGNSIAYVNDGAVWLKNLQTGSVRLLSGGLPGTTTDGAPVFSHDGSRIAFLRQPSSSLWGRQDVYVWDRATATTQLVTVSLPGIPPGGMTRGRVVAFHPTDANRLLFTHEVANLVPGDAHQREDVFVRDLAQGVTTAVSLNAAGSGTANLRSTDPMWLGNGDKVAFVTLAFDLGITDTNLATDIYVRTLSSGSYTLVSINAARDNTGNGDSGAFRIPGLGSTLYFGDVSASADGRRIVYGSYASNLAGADGNGYEGHDIFVADLVETDP